jgi:transcriptional regulator with XRE-family HTH domain
MNSEIRNLKVLGMIVRVNRVKMGYSLRDLAKLTNISHSLISNFEQGKLVPHNETIRDIFRVLNIEYYDDPEIIIQFRELRDKVFYHILFYEYEQAELIIGQLKSAEDIYLNSPSSINYDLILGLYNAIINIHYVDFERQLKHYEVILDFFTDKQKQMYFFVRGLYYLNQENYRLAKIDFQYALSIGDRFKDILIKEYYIMALSKSNRVIDAGMLARATIEEFELQANYVRAMRTRLIMAYDLYRLHKFEEALELYNQIIEFAKKYRTEELLDECYTRLSHLSIIKGEYEQAEEYFNKVSMKNNRISYYIKFDLVFNKRNDEDSLALYQEYINLDWVQHSPKTKRFFELILMRYDDKYMDTKKFEKNLVELIQIGYDHDDGELIDVASNMLATHYKKERKYKQAYEILDNLLHYNKYGSESSDYNPDRVLRFYKKEE